MKYHSVKSSGICVVVNNLSTLPSVEPKTDIDVSNFQVELSAVDNTFVAIVLNNVVSNDIVTVDIGLLNSSDALIDTYNYDKGFIESFRLNTDRAELSLICTSHFSDFSRPAGRKTNEGSQQRFFASDRGFEFAGATVQDIKWGRA